MRAGQQNEREFGERSGGENTPVPAGAGWQRESDGTQWPDDDRLNPFRALIGQDCPAE